MAVIEATATARIGIAAGSALLEHHQTEQRRFVGGGCGYDKDWEHVRRTDLR